MASSDSMMKQAAHIWSMLDDMAANDPAGYKKFLDKQMSEAKESMKPMEPHMCVSTKFTDSKEQLYINVCSWHRIPEPKTDQDPIPVMGGAMYTAKHDKGTAKMVSVSFNPKVLEEFGKDSKLWEERNLLINLAIDYIQDQHKVKVSRSYTLLPNSVTHKGPVKQLKESYGKKVKSADEQLEKDLNELEKTFGPITEGSKESMLKKLSTMALGDEDGDSQSQTLLQNEPKIKLPGDHIDQTKQGLVQELSNGKGLSQVIVLSEPEYSMDIESTNDENAKKITFKIKLPGLSSVSQCDLDIFETELQLLVPDQYELNHTLPFKVNDSTVKAKFNKKSSLLTVSMLSL